MFRETIDLQIMDRCNYGKLTPPAEYQRLHRPLGLSRYPLL